MKRTLKIGILTLSLIALALPLWASEPCCNIGVVARVNAKAGTLAVKLATNEIIELSVDNAEPVGVKAGDRVTVDFAAGSLLAGEQRFVLKKFALPKMTVAQALGAGEYEVKVQKSNMVVVRNLTTGKAKSYRRMETTGPGGVQTDIMKTKVTKPTGGVGPGSCPEGYEERCVTVSTGSSPGKEDDVISCTCIRP